MSEMEWRDHLLHKCICVSGKKKKIHEELVLADARSLLQCLRSSSINQGRERPVKPRANEQVDACRQDTPRPT